MPPVHSFPILLLRCLNVERRNYPLSQASNLKINRAMMRHMEFMS